MFKFVILALAAMASFASAQSTCTPITYTETYISYITVPATPHTETLPVPTHSPIAPYPTGPVPYYPTGTGASASWYPTATGGSPITPYNPSANGAGFVNGNVLVAAFAAVGAAAALL